MELSPEKTFKNKLSTDTVESIKVLQPIVENFKSELVKLKPFWLPIYSLL